MKKTAKENENNRYIVPAFARGLKLIELLAAHPQGLTMAEMESLELPQASLFRMLTTLVDAGYAVREKNSVYFLNGKLLRVAHQAMAHYSLPPLADPVMQSLRDETGESVMLAVLHGNEGVVIHQVVSEQAVKVVLEIGHHFPLHSAAPAKAILAFLPEEQREKLIETITFTAFTKNTIITPQDYRRELETVRKEGAAFDRGEELDDLRCVAAPVFDPQNQTVAAVWITGPASRLTKKKMKTFAAFVKEAAAKISKKLS